MSRRLYALIATLPPGHDSGVAFIFSLLCFTMGTHASPPVEAQDCAASRIGYRFQGAGWLAFSDLPGRTVGIDVGDLDHDGLPDAVVSVGYDTPVLRSYLAVAPLCFVPGHDLELSMAGQVLLEDVTGDGHLDAVVLSPVARQVGIFAGDGEGRFEEIHIEGFNAVEFANQLVVADIDEDGATDITVAGEPTFIAYGPDFSSIRRLTTNFRKGGAVVFDVDGDEDLDVLTVDRNDRFQLFRQAQPREFEVDSGSAEVFGPLDVVGTNEAGQPVILARTPRGFSSFELAVSGGEVEFTENVLESEAFSPYFHHRLGDLDGDGIDDVVLWADDQILEIRFAQAAGLPFGDSFATTIANAAGYHGVSRSQGLRDVDGDGRLDILNGNAYMQMQEGREVLATLRHGVDRDDDEQVAFVDRADGQFDQVVLALRDEIRTVSGGAAGLRERSYTSSISGLNSVTAGRIEPEGDPIVVLYGREGTVARTITPDGDLGDPVVLTGVPYRPSKLLFTEWEGRDRLISLHALRDEDLAQLSLLDPVAPWSFEAVETIVVPERTYEALVGNFDGDEHPDLALEAFEMVGILRGGPGGFQAYEPVVPLSWERRGGMASVDLDADGTSELVAFHSSEKETFLIDRTSDGSWRKTKLTSSEVSLVESTDLNGDGFQDIVADARYGMEVFYNDGQGGLASPPLILPRGGVLSSEAPLRIVDMDGDGHPDVVSGKTITYGTEERPGASVVLAELEDYRPSIVPGDLNGDGRTDLVVFYERQPAEVFMGEDDGEFGEAGSLPGEDTRAYNLMIEDFDGDGNADLVARDVTKGLLWYGGRGDGTFDDPISLGDDFLAFAGDIYGDGASELVVTRQGSGVFIRPGGQDFSDSGAARELAGVSEFPEVAFVDLDGDEREELFFQWDNFFGSGSLAFPVLDSGEIQEAVPVDAPMLSSLELFEDLDGDGLEDSLVMEGRALSLVRSRGDFTFDSVPVQEFQQAFVPVRFHDVNGDGILDILGSNSFLGNCVVEGREDGTYEEPLFFSPMTHHFVVDVNGDGLLDALATRYVEFRRGAIDAILASREHLLEGATRYEILEGRSAGADLDGDGRDELVLKASDTGHISIVGTTDTRRLEVLATLPDPEGLDDSEGGDVACGDLDGDGILDVVLHQGESLYGYRGLGSLTYEEPRLLVEGVSGLDIDVIDIDRDGIQDIFIAGFSVIRGLGNGEFAPAYHYYGEPAAVGDYNGDGLLDVAHGLDSGSVFVSHGLGAGRFGGMEALSRGRGQVGGLAVGDFNGDGIDDVAMGLVTDSEVPESARIYYGREDGPLQLGEILVDPLKEENGTRGLQVRDLNSDGYDDLLSADADGYLLAYFGSETGPGFPGAISDLPHEPHHVVAGNFGGDASLDLLSFSETGLFLTLGGIPEPLEDCDGNEVADPVEIAEDPSLDCDGDGVLDVCQIAAGTATDCNENGRLDRCEVASGDAEDLNGNGILDVCEGLQVPGDANQDAEVSLQDSLDLLERLFHGPPVFPCGSGSIHDPANVALLDANGDLEVDLADVLWLLRHLYLGGAGHVRGVDCQAIEGCPPQTGCLPAR